MTSSLFERKDGLPVALCTPLLAGLLGTVMSLQDFLGWCAVKTQQLGLPLEPVGYTPEKFKRMREDTLIRCIKPNRIGRVKHYGLKVAIFRAVDISTFTKQTNTEPWQHTLWP